MSKLTPRKTLRIIRQRNKTTSTQNKTTKTQNNCCNTRKSLLSVGWEWDRGFDKGSVLHILHNADIKITPTQYNNHNSTVYASQVGK
jgi:hypothetical protein